MALTFHNRNTLGSHPVLLPVAPGDLTFTPTPTQFSVIEAQTMGTLGTSQDGFDVAIAPVLLEFANEPGALAGLDASIFDAGFTPGQIRGTMIDPIGQDIAALTAVGDSQLGDVGTGVTGQPVATPPPFTPRITPIPIAPTPPHPAPITPTPPPAPAPAPGPGGPPPGPIQGPPGPVPPPRQNPGGGAPPGPPSPVYCPPPDIAIRRAGESGGLPPGDCGLAQIVTNVRPPAAPQVGPNKRT